VDLIPVSFALTTRSIYETIHAFRTAMAPTVGHIVMAGIATLCTVAEVAGPAAAQSPHGPTDLTVAARTTSLNIDTVPAFSWDPQVPGETAYEVLMSRPGTSSTIWGDASRRETPLSTWKGECIERYNK
jgi:hypothetical protein